ncbi:hypothetical protein V8C86DRAFT_2441332 [Haematococcus lacustris]
MGEVSVLRKRAALITPEAMDRAQPLMNPETPTGLQNLVLVQLGTVLQMRGKELHALEPKHFTKVVVADTPPGFKFVSCPVVALDLLISKLPADAAGLFIKPNPAYEVSGKWYCNQKVGLWHARWPSAFFVQSVAQPSTGYVGHHLEAQMQSMQGSFAMMQSMQMQQMHQLQQASIERMMKRMKRKERKMSP